MPITQQHAEAVARKVVDAYERSQSGPDDDSDPRVARELWQGTIDTMQAVASAVAADERLVDVNPSYSYKAAIRVSVTITVLVATDRRLWVARHAEGRVEQPVDVDYEAVRPVGKRLSLSTKVEHTPEGVTITTSRSVADWLDSLKTHRPTDTAAWLAPTAATTAGASRHPPVPAGWHADPYRRHHLRYWDGERWTEHVSTNGVQGVDPVG